MTKRLLEVGQLGDGKESKPPQRGVLRKVGIGRGPSRAMVWVLSHHAGDEGGVESSKKGIRSVGGIGEFTIVGKKLVKDRLTLPARVGKARRRRFIWGGGEK